jgi:hypothetical protein
MVKRYNVIGQTVTLPSEEGYRAIEEAFAEPKQPRPKPKAEITHHRVAPHKIAAYRCLDSRVYLNRYELAFLHSMLDRREPTDRQRALLSKLCSKCRVGRLHEDQRTAQTI